MLGAILGAEEAAVNTIRMPMSLPAFIALKKSDYLVWEPACPSHQVPRGLGLSLSCSLCSSAWHSRYSVHICSIKELWMGWMQADWVVMERSSNKAFFKKKKSHC